MNNQTVPGKTTQDDDCGCKDCKDMDNATQVSINLNRAVICSTLYDSKALVTKAETKFEGEKHLYHEKKCLFVRTEANYQRYRNFEIMVGSEILQTNDSVKASVGQLKDWNKALNTTLTTLFKQIKDAKTKFSDLKDSAYRLDSMYNDTCNNVQRKAITGKTGDNCTDTTVINENCKDSAVEFCELICLPKGLAQDADTLFQSSSDIIGIQLFSNVDSLDQMQKDLTDKSSLFEKFISDTMKSHRMDMDKLQDDLIVSVKSVTKAAIDRNSQRATFEAYYDATSFICCPDCSCTPSDENQDNLQYNHDKKSSDDCPPRLKECQKEICEICDDVKTTFCCTDTTSPGNTGAQVNYTKKQ